MYFIAIDNVLQKQSVHSKNNWKSKMKVAS